MKILFFDLGARILDGHKGARYNDVIGMKHVIKETLSMNHDTFDISFDIMDDLSFADEYAYDYIFISPKPEYLFHEDKITKTQIDFLRRVKKLPKKYLPKIFIYLDDIKLKFKGKYLGVDPFKGLKLNLIVDYQNCDKMNKVKNIFVSKRYQKKIKTIYTLSWLCSAYLGYYRNIQIDDSVYQEYMKTHDRINNLYYGDYRKDAKKSLIDMGFGEDPDDLMIGNNKMSNGLANCLPKMTMKQVIPFIQNAEHNLLPFEAKKTNHQITARILELLLFSKDANHITDDRWDIIELIKNKELNSNFSKDDLNKNLDDINDMNIKFLRENVF